MGKSYASLTFMLGANIKEFQTAMRKASKELKKTGKQMQSMGKSMSMYVTAPLLAMGGASVIAFDKQAKAIAQVEAGLKSTRGQAGFTSDALQKMAADLQNTTLFGDEEILKDATAQLLTFTNIAGDQFVRTQQAALDLATRIDQDLKSSSIQLGKALNDPVANLSALSRSGIQFSVKQKEVINALVKTNRLAEAQTVILDELERQYGGSAEAAANAGAGPLTQLKNIIGDLAEEFGKIIMDYLKPFIAKLKEWALAFKELNPEAKKIIVIIAAIAAAMGPLLIALGTLAVILPAIATGLAAIFSPVTLVIAAIAGIAAAFVYVVGNWDAFKERLGDWSWIKNAAIDMAQVLIKSFKMALSPLLDLLGIDFTPMMLKLEDMKAPITKSKTEFKTFGTTLKDTIKAVMNSFGMFKDGGTEDLKAVETQATTTTAAIKTMGESLGVKGPTAIRKNKPTTSVASTPKPQKGINFEANLQLIKDFGAKLNKAWANLPIASGIDAFKTRYSQKMNDLVQTMNDIANAAFADFGVFIGEAIGNLLSGEKINFGATVLESIGNFLKEMGKALIIYAGIIKAFEKTFTNPFVAIAVGIAAVAAGTILLNKAKAGPDAPGLIHGGVVPEGYPNDSYPARLSSKEIVAPPQKLESFFAEMMQKMNPANYMNSITMAMPNAANIKLSSLPIDIEINGTFRQSGSDMVAVIDKANIKRTRVRGY